MDTDQTSFHTPATNALATALAEVIDDTVRQRILDNLVGMLDEARRQERAACAHECVKASREDIAVTIRARGK